MRYRPTFAVLAAVLACRAAMPAGILEVASEPAGAVISINDKAVARAPCAVRLSAGTHVVSAAVKGYDTELRVVKIEEDKTTKLEIRLGPTPVEITVKCNVDEAVVYVDGVLVGKVNEKVEAPPGVRELAVVSKGYRDSVSTVRIPRRGKKTFNIRLTPGISFRSGTIALHGGNWRNFGDPGWRFIGGRVFFSSGNGASLNYQGPNIERTQSFAMSYRFRCKNVKSVRIAVSGVYAGTRMGGNRIQIEKFKDGKWHTVLIEVSGRASRTTIDGGIEGNRTAATISTTVTVNLTARAPGNNDPYFAEVGSMVYRGFDTPQAMASALGTSVVK